MYKRQIKTVPVFVVSRHYWNAHNVAKDQTADYGDTTLSREAGILVQTVKTIVTVNMLCLLCETRRMLVSKWIATFGNELTNTGFTPRQMMAAGLTGNHWIPAAA